MIFLDKAQVEEIKLIKGAMIKNISKKKASSKSEKKI